MLSGSELARVQTLLDAHCGLAALWVFGSEASGTVRFDSDVDLAALFRVRVSPEALVDARLELSARLGRPVDLVDLSRASPIVAMQAVRHGQLVCDADRSARLRFLTMLPSRYEDLRIARAPAERRLLEGLSGRA
jgi:predicted nucleotidyltransferase